MRLLAAVLLVGLCSCVGHPRIASRAETEHREIEAGKAERLGVELQMGAGDLRVRGGAPKLAVCDFTFNPPSIRPQVRYDDSSFRGRLSITQTSQVVGSGMENKWNMQLSDAVPVEMNLHLGAGEAKLNLASLDLQRLAVEVGAGEADIDLRGAYKRNVTLHVKGGVGEVTLRLPRDVGVNISAHGGIGEISGHNMHRKGDAWVNDAWGTAPVSISGTVEGGIGQINLRVE